MSYLFDLLEQQYCFWLVIIDNQSCIRHCNFIWFRTL